MEQTSDRETSYREIVLRKRGFCCWGLLARIIEQGKVPMSSSYAPGMSSSPNVFCHCLGAVGRCDTELPQMNSPDNEGDLQKSSDTAPQTGQTDPARFMNALGMHNNFPQYLSLTSACVSPSCSHCQYAFIGDIGGVVEHGRP